MTKFKIGDKVRIVGNKLHSENKVGEIGVITDLNCDNCFVEVVKDRFGCYHVFSDLELVTEKPKFYKEVITKNFKLNREYIDTVLPSGDTFTTSGGSESVYILTEMSFIKNDDIPAIIDHLQQWYDAVQLEKGNNK